MKMAPFDRVADPFSALRTDLKAQEQAPPRTPFFVGGRSAPARRNDLLPPLEG